MRYHRPGRKPPRLPARRSGTISPRLALIGALGLCLCFTGCRGQAGEKTRPDAPHEALPEALLPVTLPDLMGLQLPVREQLQAHYARLQALTDSAGVRRADLGAAYGRMGQLLLAYDLKDAAAPALADAAALLPDDARWPYYLGLVYQNTGQLEQAAGQIEHALTLQPDNMPARIRLAQVYRDLGREGAARTLLEETLRLDPACAAAHFMLGQMADPDASAEAIAHYEAVLRLQPTATVVHNPLGLAYRKQGDLERSRLHLARRGDRGIVLDDPLLREIEHLKQGSDVKMARASSLMSQGQIREAAALFEEAASEDSLNATAYLNLGAARARLGQTDRAIEALERALHLDPSNSNALYNLGVLYRQRGERQKTLAHFRAATAANPDNINAHFELAKLLKGDGRCREAIPHFDRFLEASPGNVEVRIQDALCHVKEGDYAGARALIETGFEAFPDQLGLQDAMVRVLAASPDAQVRDGQRAVEIAERLAATLPRPETLESLAMAYAELGRFPAAVRRQREAIQLAEQSGQAVMVEALQATLRRYQQGQPCRTPWPSYFLQ